MVVDDDEGTRKILSALLKSEGHAVHACEAAELALSQLSAAPADMLLTDLVMPGMTGLELVSAARELSCPPRRIVVMSGHAPTEAANDIAWLRKPIDVDALFELVDALG